MTKCHTGPGCRLHSPANVQQAFARLQAAETALVVAKGYEQYATAKKEYDDATAQYDATDYGQNALKSAIKQATDLLARAQLEGRLRQAERLADDIEQESNKQDPEFRVSQAHTFEPLQYPAADAEGVQHGPKYIGRRPTEELMRDIRADIKEAQKAGYLPTGPNFIVHAEQGKTNSIIHISVEKAVGKNEYTAETARELRHRLLGLAEQYNRVNNSTSNPAEAREYETRVHFETAQQSEQRRAVTKARRTLKADTKAETAEQFVAEKKLTMQKTARDGVRFEQVPTEGGVFYAFLASHGGKTALNVYDFSSLGRTPAQLDADFKRAALGQMIATTTRKPFLSF